MEHAYLEIARSLAINQSRRSSIALMSPGTPINTANSLTGTLPFSGWANLKQTGSALLCTDCSAFRVYGRLRLVTSLRYLATIWTCGWAIVASWSDIVYSDVP
jgi:hypothetical protein